MRDLAPWACLFLQTGRKDSTIVFWIIGIFSLQPTMMSHWHFLISNFKVSSNFRKLTWQITIEGTQSLNSLNVMKTLNMHVLGSVILISLINYWHSIVEFPPGGLIMRNCLNWLPLPPNILLTPNYVRAYPYQQCKRISH
jgi:hypothetical protein